MTKDIPAKKRVTDAELVDALLSYTAGYYAPTSSSVHPKYMTPKIAELRGELLNRLAAKEPTQEYCDPFFDYDNKELIDKYINERSWNDDAISSDYAQEPRLLDAILSRMSPAKKAIVEDSKEYIRDWRIKLDGPPPISDGKGMSDAEFLGNLMDNVRWYHDDPNRVYGTGLVNLVVNRMTERAAKKSTESDDRAHLDVECDYTNYSNKTLVDSLVIVVTQYLTLPAKYGYHKRDDMEYICKEIIDRLDVATKEPTQSDFKLTDKTLLRDYYNLVKHKEQLIRSVGVASYNNRVSEIEHELLSRMLSAKELIRSESKDKATGTTNEKLVDDLIVRVKGHSYDNYPNWPTLSPEIKSVRQSVLNRMTLQSGQGAEKKCKGYPLERKLGRWMPTFGSKSHRKHIEQELEWDKDKWVYADCGCRYGCAGSEIPQSLTRP